MSIVGEGLNLCEVTLSLCRGCSASPSSCCSVTLNLNCSPSISNASEDKAVLLILFLPKFKIFDGSCNHTHLERNAKLLFSVGLVRCLMLNSFLSPTLSLLCCLLKCDMGFLNCHRSWASGQKKPPSFCSGVSHFVHTAQVTCV